jgi:AcrR family transcriptional regulator
VATQAERTAATTSAVVAAARRLFAERGWAATSMEQVAREAGVTKGALYHHYQDKTALLAAVYEDQECRSVEHLLARSAAVDPRDPLEALRVGSRAFLEECLDPTFRAIALVEAPAGLGWERWRKIDLEHGFGLMRTAVAAAIEAGQLQPLPVDQVSHLLLAALMEAALLLGQAEDPAAELELAAATFDALVEGLTA